METKRPPHPIIAVAANGAWAKGLYIISDAVNINVTTDAMIDHTRKT